MKTLLVMPHLIPAGSYTIDPSTGCWLWLGKLGAAGYPEKNIKRSGHWRVFKLCRLICEVTHGDMTGLVARHTCNNPKCVNPEHIIPGTHADNMADLKAHDPTHNKGARNGMAKLTDKAVSEIRSMSGSKSQRNIAATFGISQSAVSRIINGERW